MFSMLKGRALVIGLGCLLLAALIWYGGPYIGLGEYRPLESETARYVLMALIAAGWAASALLRRVRAQRANEKLAAAIVHQSPREARPSADAVQLRERFEEAVATLKQTRRSGHSLYDLPWYVFIGAPGSGKTTALVNSGLRFPLEQRSGKTALRGVGGTRNCDWWFTDDAVFLDTAGRYTTQDSDAAADSAGWTEFLALLRKYRGRRPINGIVLTISAQDLIVLGADGREAHVDAARRRLQEINRELQIQLPVYVMVTKCDLVAGFTEYFSDLTQEGRAQVWGVTFPYEQTQAGEAAAKLPAEFDALIARLNERLFSRVEEDRDVRRRVQIFGFPQQMSALREALTGFVGDVFASTRFEKQILLRGVYFTSGTQEGTPIDRLLGTIGRGFAVAPDAVVPGGRGKAYFIERLLQDVVFAESGLAGVNRRMEVQKAALQLGAYAALVLVTVLGVVALSVSYSRNRAYLDEVAGHVETLREVPAAPASASPEMLLPRLDAVRAVAEAADRYREHAPWSMRWGLYQGAPVGNAARDAYVRELNTVLMPRVAARFERRLDAFVEPEIIYDYLKAYLMLGGRAPRMDVPFLLALERENRAPDDRLSVHFESLLENGPRLRAVTLNETLVAQARNTIRGASVPHLAYRSITRYYAGDTARAVRLDIQAGVGAERVLRRRSGRSLSEPVPALFTRQVFEEVTTTSGITELARAYASEQWVWGDGGMPSSTAATLQADVLRIYEDEYIQYWEGLVDDVAVASMAGQEVAPGLGILAGATSPLRGFYQTVTEHTLLVKPPEGAESGGGPSFLDRASQIGRGILSGRGEAAVAAPPGTRITARFKPIHDLVAGAPGSAPIDRTLGELRQVQQLLATMGIGVGQVSPSDPDTQVKVRAGVRSLNDGAATLPPPVRSLMREAGELAERAAAGGARSGLLSLYRERVVAECTALIAGRYPFAVHPTSEVLLEDFARLFGPSGTFDRFFAEQLASLIDVGRTPWTWRPGLLLGLPGELPRQFERARSIRDTFFRAGAVPQLTFALTPESLDSEVRRFRLQVGGSPPLEYTHGPVRRLTVTWPGTDPGPVVATFEDGSGAPPYRSYDGAWAWFRMVDEGEFTQVAPERYELAIRSGGRTARLHMEMRSVINPFARRDLLQQFRCDAS